MNKKIISALVLAGMIMGSNAFASRSRLNVMGTGGAAAGSFYYDHIYNIFYNPSYINDMKNYVIFEKDATEAAFMGTAFSAGGFNLGVYMNRAGAFNAAGTGSTFAEKEIDFVIGGDQGVKWGAGLTYAQRHAAGPDATNRDVVLRAGIQMNGFDPFAEFQVVGSNKDAATEEKHKRMVIGTKYHYGEWTPYAQYASTKRETATENKNSQFTLGVGREAKLAEGARLNYAIYWQRSQAETAGVKGVANSVIPLEAAVEADATSWFTARAGFQYNLMNSNSTTLVSRGRVGGTFHLGKADVDFAFGNDNDSTATSAGGNIDTGTIGFSDDTFAQVAVRYSW